MNRNIKTKDYPLVSIVVPVYNVEHYVDRAIDSIINQTYQNIEILLIDDGSEDTSGIICDKWSSEYSNIKTYHGRNQGLAVARNIGVAHSVGEWIVFIDSDDWVEPRYVEYLLEKALKYDLDVGMCGYYTEYGDFHTENSFFKYHEKKFKIEDKNALLRSCVISTEISSSNTTISVGVAWAKIYKKSFLIGNNLWAVPGLKRMQDMIFNLYAFQKANRIYYSNKAMYHYSKENANAATMAKCTDFAETALNILNELEKFKIISNMDDFDEVICCKAIKLIIEAIDLQFTNKRVGYINNLKGLNTFVYKTSIWKYVTRCKGVYLSNKQKILMNLIKHHMLWVAFMYLNN